MVAKLDQQLHRLAALPPADLPDEWRRVWKAPAPRLSPDLLRMGLAYRLQEKALGKLPARVARSIRSPSAAPTIKPGTQLVRGWNGRSITVLVADDGYVFEGQTYRSLTAIAKLVTGAGWSGPRFFGLNDRG